MRKIYLKGYKFFRQNKREEKALVLAMAKVQKNFSKLLIAKNFGQPLFKKYFIDRKLYRYEIFSNLNLNFFDAHKLRGKTFIKI